MAERPPDLVERFLSAPDSLEALRAVVARAGHRGGSPIDADDLIQDVAVRALIAKDSFRGHTESELLAWLRSIAKRRLIDGLRAARHSPGPLPVALPDRDGRSPDALAEDRDQLARALGTLPPLEAALLKARYGAGLSFAQIGRIIEMSPETVRQVHHRLLLRLRRRTPRSRLDR